MKYTETGTDFDHSVAYTYDNLNNLTGLKETINGSTLTTNYTYDDDNRVTKVENSDNNARTYTYDGFGRLLQRTTSCGDTAVLTEDFTFHASNGMATNQLKAQQFTTVDRNITYSYTYDGNGNIASIKETALSPRAVFPSETTTGYIYDTQNQLVRENNEMANRTWIWTYDHAGNITSRSEYTYTTGTPTELLDTVVYGYTDSDWGDLLTSYDGKTITYDQIGNPLRDGTWRYSWEHGRQLASMFDGKNTVWNYTYDANGMRTSRTDGTTTYTYVYNGGLLSQMTIGDNVLLFAYDASGTPMTMTCNGVVYYYVTNAQGDVIAILNSTGNVVSAYTYDAWGNILVQSTPDVIGRINPLRYRGYVYDRETELYYLQSRYYNPEIGRFLNADAYTSTGQSILSNNMFAYCGNNPVNRSDPSGYNWASVILEFQNCLKKLQEAVNRIVNKVIDELAYTEDTYLNTEQMKRNATIVYRYLSKNGWSHNAICATLGNMQQESNINPGMSQRGGGNAFGIVQWDPSTKYTNWAAANGYANDSIIGQLEFLIYSIQPGKGEWFKNTNHSAYYLKASDFICSNKDVEYLTAVFLYSYERAGTPKLDLRIKYALQWSEFFS